MTYEEQTGTTIKDAFISFHLKNPHVYASFEQQALKAFKKGRKVISAKLLINWIRWNESFESTDANFKINDAFQSHYPRLFVQKNPNCTGEFRFRKQRSEESGPYMLAGPNGQLAFL